MLESMKSEEFKSETEGASCDENEEKCSWEQRQVGDVWS